VQRTAIFVAMVRYPRFEGAAHRNIKFNVTVRCTFNLDVADFCYKYYGALHLNDVKMKFWGFRIVTFLANAHQF
jgi:hypothetical protein